MFWHLPDGHAKRRGAADAPPPAPLGPSTIEAWRLEHGDGRACAASCACAALQFHSMPASRGVYYTLIVLYVELYLRTNST